MSGYNSNVGRWLNDVERLVPNCDPAVVLALIAVESAGNPEAHRPGSQFYGLLQIGRPVAMKTGARDRGRNTASMHHGDAERSLRAFSAYLAFFAKWLQGDPELTAIMWKGGPRFAQRVKEHDGTIEEAIEEVTAFYANLDPPVHIPNVQEYLDRFRGHYAVYSERLCS